jgi:Ni/Co efflux regulator RcnB
MHAQKNPFKVALMTLVAVGLTTGAFALSAQADDKDDQKFDHFACYEVKKEESDTKHRDKEDQDKKDQDKVVLYNQFEGGARVHIGELKLLCVPTHKEHHKDDGQKDDDKDDKR